MVHRPAFPPQQRGEAPVAVVPVTDSQALEHIPQLYLFPFGSDAPPVPVVTRAADARQRAHPLDGQAALRGRHRVDEREDAVAPRPPQGGLSIERMCALAGVSRASYYRHWRRVAPEREQIELRDVLQRLAVGHRHYGYRRLTALLRREGWAVNHKRILRLMRTDNLLCP